jgi:hypothetical protein
VLFNDYKYEFVQVDFKQIEDGYHHADADHNNLWINRLQLYKVNPSSNQSLTHYQTLFIKIDYIERDTLSIAHGLMVKVFLARALLYFTYNFYCKLLQIWYYQSIHHSVTQ